MGAPAWKRKALEALPHRRWDEDIGEIHSLVILPSRRKHESGYRCLDFVAVRDGVPICRLSGCSDVINLDGIGGYNPRYSRIGTNAVPGAWAIDCLPNGLLQIWNTHGPMVVGPALSTFEVFACPRKEKP